MSNRTYPVLLAAVVVVAGACTPQPTPGPDPVPACPARQVLTVDRVEPARNYNDRAVAPGGGWVLGLEAVDGDAVASVWSVGETAAVPVASQAVAVAPTDVADSKDFWIGDDGVVTRRGRGSRPTERWDPTTGTVQQVPEPSVPVPPGAYAIDTEVHGVFGGGERLLWHHEYVPAGLPNSESNKVFHVVVTDNRTDAVVATTEVDQVSELTPGSPDGRFVIAWQVGDFGSPRTSADLVDTQTDSILPLDDMVAAIPEAAPPDSWYPPLVPQATSPSGRYVLVNQQRDAELLTNRAGLWVWDTVESSATLVSGQLALTYGWDHPRAASISDDGLVTYVRADQTLVDPAAYSLRSHDLATGQGATLYSWTSTRIDNDTHIVGDGRAVVLAELGPLPRTDVGVTLLRCDGD